MARSAKHAKIRRAILLVMFMLYFQLIVSADGTEKLRNASDFFVVLALVCVL